MIILEHLGTLLTVFSLIFGVVQYLQKRNIEKIIIFEAIELHKNIAIALGATQGAKNAVNNNLSPSFEIGKAEGMCQAILYESAKLYCNLKNTKIDDIDNLIDAKQLNDQYKEIYYSFSSKKRGPFLKMIKNLSSLF